MADSMKEGLSVTFEGIVCTPEYEYTRNVGLEPDFGFVHVHKSDFQEYRLEEVGFDALAADSALTTRDKSAPRSPGVGFQTQGGLIISEVINGEEHAVRFSNVLVDDRAIESVIAFDDSSDVVRVQLTDIRKRWKNEGIVFGWINIPKQASGQPGADKDLPGRPIGSPTTTSRPSGAGPAGSGAAPDASKPSPLFGGDPAGQPGANQNEQRLLRQFYGAQDPPPQLQRTPDSDPRDPSAREVTLAPLGRETHQSVSGAPAPGLQEYVSGSLRNGKPWTLLQVLQRYILPNLPGRPTLKRIPDDVKDSITAAHEWDGWLTKRALSELLEEFQLELALNPDSSISLWHMNEGELQDDKFSKISDDPSSANVDDRVSSKRPLIGMNFVPQAVLVLGPPILDTARISDLEPVGEVGGKIVPLEEFLHNINLNMDQAKVFAFANHHERTTFFKVDTDGLRRFERCAFKWYRLPGGASANGGKLPMLPRGRVDEVGQLLPIRVWSESLQVSNGAALVKDRLGITDDAKHTGSKALDALVKSDALNFLCVTNLGFHESTSGFDVDAEQGVIKFDSIQGAVGGEEFGAGSGGQSFTGKEAAQGGKIKQGGINVENEMLAAANAIEAGGNVAAAEALRSAAGLTSRQNASKDSTEGVTLQEAFLARPARVQVEFGFSRKPSFEANVSIEDRYNSFWIREQKNGKANVRKLDHFAPDSIARTIYRDDLQQVNAADGATNKGVVDAIAEKLARQVLEQPPVTYGGIVQLHRPVSLINTGRVKSITWGVGRSVPTGEPVPRVTAHVGMIAPLTPKPELRTLAKRGPDTASIKSHVLAPRGMTQ